MLGFLNRLLGRAQGVPEQAVAEPEPLDRADVVHQIHVLARGGFHSEVSALTAVVEDYLDPDRLDPEDRRWVEAEVERAFETKRADEAVWPAITDFDRLVAAFDALTATGIVALHRAGYTRSDGISDAWEVYHQGREEGVEARGFAFYHGQDVEAVGDGGLYLAFGAFDERDEMARRIGGEIVSAVEAQGLGTRWEGDVDTRILIWPIDWRKRSPVD
ncbi:DUF3168 domain-containing protein [Aureimonas flava]|uniref:DUF3168 domain-containing protein n=1 Tax=Aureimonas flava TaxID=2320271 RepID=A0A3A1WKY8_9HYPH|nr:DUF3168 domain-containing protein [Aureimonas flava]RIY01432.1 DUF3168 domain-containing protein [Aureimonas flava]